MPNRFQIKRTTTSGLLPNVSNSSNTSYIAAGELAINLTDRKLLSSNGSATFEVGANLTNLAVSGNVSATYYIGDGSYLTGLYGVVGEYLFANTVSDVSPYYQAQFVGNYTAGTTAQNTVSVTSSPTLLGAFLTNVGFPNQTYIPIGTIGVAFETQKASGASTYRTYAEIYKRTSGGTETLLITSDVSSTSALNTLIQQSVSATNSTQITLNLTDRILIKIYAQIISGADTNITLRWDDATSSGFNLPAPPASITQFVPYLNATANVNLDSYSIIAASHTVGTTLAANATGLFVSSAAPQISLNNATSNWITFSTNGVAAPTTNTRSAGTKLALYPSLNASQVDYAIGIESNHMWFSTDNATTGVKFYANTSNYMTANVAGLYHTGDITAFFSDDRLKDRYSNIPNAVEKVKLLNGFYYEPNITAQDLGYQKEMHVGVSAQEVNAIMPEVVAPAPIDNKYMTVKYDRLIPLLIEAIKEQQIQIDELKAQLNKD
jgi:hypothetical protein